MFVADGFASSTAGYITGILTPIGTAMIGALFGLGVRQLRLINLRLTTQDKALAEQSQALAVVVSQVAPLSDRVTKVEDVSVTLTSTTAVLHQALTDHKEWAIREHDRTTTRLDNLTKSV